MAVVIRYFSTADGPTSDGSGDSWANRVALIVSGDYSSVILDFNHSGSDSLLCLVGPGTYSPTVSLDGSSHTIATPTRASPLIFHGCDSSGSPLVPELGWVSAQPAWDTSALPVLATTTNIPTMSLNNVIVRMLAFTASGRNGGMLAATDFDWCSIHNSTNNAAALCASGMLVGANSLLECSAADYANIVNLSTAASSLHNCRLQGAGGSSATRQHGVEVTGASTGGVFGCTILDSGRHGIYYSGSTASAAFLAIGNTIVAADADGIRCNGAASQSRLHTLLHNLIVNCGAYGINGQSAARVLLAGNRMRDNASGATSGLGNYPDTFDNETAAGEDAVEFFDFDAGDYRTKFGTDIYGEAFGVADAARVNFIPQTALSLVGE